MDRTWFTNVSVFDASGAAPYPGSVLVQGERIAAVQRGSVPPLAGDARLVDGGGATLMPGLVDAHAHLALGSTIHQINPPGDRSDTDTALLMAHCGRVFLDSGFTSAYSGGSASPVAEVAVQKAFDAGWVAGPRLHTSSFERVPGGPMGLQTRFAGAASRPANPAEVVAFVREMAALGVQAVKFLLNGVSAFDPASNFGEQFHDEEIEAAAAAAREVGLSLTAHCYTPHSIRLAVRTGFRVLYHCNHADEAALDALESRKDRIFVGPAPGIVEADLLRGPKFGIMASPAQREEQQRLAESARAVGQQMRRRGLRLVPGGDYGFPWNPVGLNARDLTLFVEWFGYTPTEALLAATRLGGELMERPNEIGRIAPGYLADLLLVRGDPTADIRILENHDNLRAVMQGGRFHKTPAESGRGP